MSAFAPRRILAAFDFSERALHAWRYARSLGERLGCPVDAVFVARMDVEPGRPFFEPMAPRRRAAILRKLSAELGVSRGLHVREGDAALGILRTAEAEGAGLIVMGEAEVRGRLRELTTTEAVARSSRVPVLSLHGDVPLPGSILAPVNGRPYSLEGQAFAEGLAEALGAELVVRRFEGDAVAGIIEEARRHDLTVLSVHRRGLFHDAFIGLTAERVLRRSLTPVVCVPSGYAMKRRLASSGHARARARRRARRAAGHP